MKRRKATKRPTAGTARNIAQFGALSFDEQERRAKAFEALKLMRNGRSRKRAAAEAGITPSAMQKIVGSALEKRGSRYVAKKGDRLLRFMVIPSPSGGKREVAVRGSRQASLIAQYDNAVRRYVYEGDAAALERFHGISVTSGGERIPLMTSLDEIDRLAAFHQLSFENIYARIG